MAPNVSQPSERRLIRQRTYRGWCHSAAHTGESLRRKDRLLSTTHRTNSRTPRDSPTTRSTPGAVVVIDDHTKARLLSALRDNQGAGLSSQRHPRSTTDSLVPRQRGVGPNGRPTLSSGRSCSSKKQCFPSEQAARARLAQIHGSSHTGRLYGPINIHSCGKCGEWHLTAKTQKPWKHGRRRR